MNLSSVQFSSVISHISLQPHGLQHARLPCPSPTPRACSNSCPLSRWCHPTILSSVIPFFLQTFPASGSFPMSQFFPSRGQSTDASASVLPMNIQDWLPLGLTGWISLQSKWLSRVFSNLTPSKVLVSHCALQLVAFTRRAFHYVSSVYHPLHFTRPGKHFEMLVE